MLQFSRTRLFRIAAVIVLLVLLYALAGFWLAPRLIRKAILHEIPQSLAGVTPKVGEIRVNPFLFQVEVKDFSLTGSQGTQLLGFGRFFIDFELSSLWHRAYSFSHIDIGAPFVNAVVFKDGRLNLLQLRPAPKPASPPARSAPPPVRIGSFKVTDGLVTYDDRSRPSDFAARLEPINVELRNFTTGVDGGRFTFTGESKLGERIEWHGHVAVQPIESDGEFRIGGLQAHTIWNYLEDTLNFQVPSGKIDVEATYQFALRDALELKLDVAKAVLTNLKIRPRESDADWIALPELTLSGTHLDLQKRLAHSDSLSLTGLKVDAWREADGSINLAQLAALRSATAAADTAASARAVPPAVTTVGGPASAPTPWQFDLGEFALHAASLAAEDRSTRPAPKVMLAPIELKVEGASLDTGKPVTLTLDTTIDGKGSLSVAGRIVPSPLRADLELKLAGIELAAIQPYIAQHTSMTLLAGALSGDGHLLLGGGKQPAMQFGGNLSLAGLRTVDNALHDDFINWERLDVAGLKFQHDPDRLDIEQISVRKPYARVIVEPDETINVRRVLAVPGATAVAAGPKATAGAPTMPMSIKRVSLQGGTANFTDLTLRPNFSTGIDKLHGTILGLSSNANSRAKIDLHGSVDEFAPVAITGEVNALGPVLYTNLSMIFSNIELSTFNPYSGKFAGYDISKGKLTTELHYRVEGRKLDAQHHIVIDQLEFGEKTASKDAVSLPIKLAVALLKDRQGVIDLNLPVTGSLDDPKFRLGPIIWKVFVNILEKAVTAPFALLGSLFGGGPDLQFVDFQPGSAALDRGASEKTNAIVKALDARPQLKIEIPIAVVKDLDSAHLADAKFQAQLREAQLESGGRKKPAPGSSFEQLEPPAQLEILSKLYSKQLGAEVKYPQSVTAIKPQADLIAAKIDFLEMALRERITVGETELTALGEQRAMNVQAALLSGTQIDPSRVFLVANDKAKNQDGRVRLELSLR